MTPDDRAMHEYQTLRDEIARHENQIFEVFKFALTGAVAIIAFGLQQLWAGNPAAWAIVATVPLVVIPAGVLTLSRTQQEMRIGAYIEAFFEEGDDALNWEQVLRKRCRVDARPDDLLKLAMFSGYMMVGLAGIGLAAWLAKDIPLGRWVVGIELVVIAGIALLATRLMATGKRGDMESGDYTFFLDLHNRREAERGAE